MTDLEEGLVRIEITRLAKTGMLIGVSDTMRGLIVHGRNVEEMETRIPQAIASLLEAAGFEDVAVTKMDDEGTDDAASGLTTRRYTTTYRKAAVLH